MEFWLVEESHVVKDRVIGVIWLDAKARSCCSDKRLWSADEKKTKLFGNRWTGGWELLELDPV